MLLQLQKRGVRTFDGTGLTTFAGRRCDVLAWTIYGATIEARQLVVAAGCASDKCIPEAGQSDGVTAPTQDGRSAMDPVTRLIEIEAIKDTRHMYSHYFDGRRLDDLVGLFTADAVCEFGAAYGGDWIGRAQIRTNYARYLSADAPAHGVMHSVTNPWIRLDSADSARGRWYLLDLHTSPGVENPLILFGIYDDLYRKVDGRWLIHRTRIDFLWPNRDYRGPREL